jgi:Amino acid permease
MSPNEPPNPVSKTASLQRSLSLPLLTFYGLGTIVGGGFYALIGKVSLHAGLYTPFAFMTAAFVALFSAFSFAELSARFPKSAGESVYVREAFQREHLSTAVGWMVILTGVVSAATLATAIAGFLKDLIGLNPMLSIFGIVLGLGLIAAWGIMESVITAIIITVIEIGGLLFIVFVAREHLMDLPQHLPEIFPPFSLDAWKGILLGGFLAFYSFIGFEDMVNVAEEVKNPRRNLPIAILLSLLLTTILYFFVTLAAVSSVPLQQLGQSHTPLAEVVASWGPGTQKTIGVISILAGVNGALVVRYPSQNPHPIAVHRTHGGGRPDPRSVVSAGHPGQSHQQYHSCNLYPGQSGAGGYQIPHTRTSRRRAPLSAGITRHRIPHQRRLLPVPSAGKYLNEGSLGSGLMNWNLYHLNFSSLYKIPH